MLSRACCLLSLLSMAACPTAADEGFPYTAHAARQGVTYHSGPGAKYYASGQLAAGEAVEVYRHDTGGWCAIRPPEGSFSWVDEAHLQPLGDGLAEVLGHDAVTCVGSLLTDQRDVRQVRLDAGEMVEILDRVTEGEGPDARRWFKIAPPAGEFRWVHRDDLSMEPSAAAAPAQDQRRNLLISDESSDGAQAFPVSVAGHAAEEIDGDGTGDDADDEQPARPATGWKADRRGPREKSAAAAIPEPPVSANVTEELDTIELAISRIVAGEPQDWTFDRWKERAAAVKSRATATADRSRASSLLRRMKRFDDIHQRAVALTAGASDELTNALDNGAEVQDSTATPRAPTDAPPTVAEVNPRVAESRDTKTIGEPGAIQSDPFAQPATPTLGPSDDRYDGVGRLARVVSKTAGLPQYVLLDDQGVVRHYVTPAPGVNLKRYLGHQVGIVGLRAFVPELNANHVTAKRVTAMDGGRLLR
jgi:SH3-like domain-containing protein